MVMYIGHQSLCWLIIEALMSIITWGDINLLSFSLTLSLYSTMGKKSYLKISQSLTAAKLGIKKDQITLKFDRLHSNSIASVPGKFYGCHTNLNPYLAASRLHQILGSDVILLIGALEYNTFHLESRGGCICHVYSRSVGDSVFCRCLLALCGVWFQFPVLEWGHRMAHWRDGTMRGGHREQGHCDQGHSHWGSCCWAGGVLGEEGTHWVWTEVSEAEDKCGEVCWGINMAKYNWWRHWALMNDIEHTWTVANIIYGDLVIPGMNHWTTQQVGNIVWIVCLNLAVFDLYESNWLHCQVISDENIFQYEAW